MAHLIQPLFDGLDVDNGSYVCMQYVCMYVLCTQIYFHHRCEQAFLSDLIVSPCNVAVEMQCSILMRLFVEPMTDLTLTTVVTM